MRWEEILVPSGLCSSSDAIGHDCFYNLLSGSSCNCDSAHRQARLLFRLEELTPKLDPNPRQGCSMLQAGVDDCLQVPGETFRV